MVHKKWIIILCILLVVSNGLVIFGFMHHNKKVVAAYEEERAKLVATINAFGSEVTVYTVKSSVQPGEEITNDNIVTMTQCSSMVSDQMVRNPSEILGKEFKIGLVNGTPITYNMVMEEPVRADTRDVDIVLDNWTVGLVEGDYIDVKITMPYGDDYIVIPHKRVYEVNENTLKLHLTADEWNMYVGAYVDYALNKAYGAVIYAAKYVEPGLQESAIAYYAVPTNIAALLQKNPNITNKEAVASTNQWRSSIEEMLSIFRDEEDTVDSDGAKLQEMREAYNDAVRTDVETQREDAERNGENEDEDEDEVMWTDTNPVGAPDMLDENVPESAGDINDN